MYIFVNLVLYTNANLNVSLLILTDIENKCAVTYLIIYEILLYNCK